MYSHGGSRAGSGCRKAPRLYSAWLNMKNRCYNLAVPSYQRYGGRGISVCPDWLGSFAAFREWALGSGYTDDLTLDRVNPDGNYEPSNCQWLTKSENSKKMFSDSRSKFKQAVECAERSERLLAMLLQPSVEASRGHMSDLTRIEKFLGLIRSDVFRPFTIHMADGRSIRVTHPEAVAYGGGRTAAVATSRRTFEIIDLLLVPSLETEDAITSPQEASGSA